MLDIWASSWENLSCYIQNLKTLASFCSWAGQFESYLIANPEDRFSHDEAHIWVNPYWEEQVITNVWYKFLHLQWCRLINRNLSIQCYKNIFFNLFTVYIETMTLHKHITFLICKHITFLIFNQQVPDCSSWIWINAWSWFIQYHCLWLAHKRYSNWQFTSHTAGQTARNIASLVCQTYISQNSVKWKNLLAYTTMEKVRFLFNFKYLCIHKPVHWMK